MIARIFWGLVIGSLAALAWIGYRRGAFERDNMRYGMDRLKEGLQTARHRAREGLKSARDRIRMAARKTGHMTDEAHAHIEQGMNI